MASIVVVTRFCESDGKPFGEYINYIDRDNATKRDALEKYNLFGEYIGYMENEEKTVQGLTRMEQKRSAACLQETATT